MYRISASYSSLIHTFTPSSWLTSHRRFVPQVSNSTFTAPAFSLNWESTFSFSVACSSIFSVVLPDNPIPQVTRASPFCSALHLYIFCVLHPPPPSYPFVCHTHKQYCSSFYWYFFTPHKHPLGALDMTRPATFVLVFHHLYLPPSHLLFMDARKMCGQDTM